MILMSVSGFFGVLDLNGALNDSSVGLDVSGSCQTCELYQGFVIQFLVVEWLVSREFLN